MPATKKLIEQTIARRKGLLFTLPELVFRNTYTGRGILADNKSVESPGADFRGYVPVERWITSVTQAENIHQIEGEGISKVELPDGSTIRLDEIAEGFGARVFGSYLPQWPLVKILDIGGDETCADYLTVPEVPPIPVHVHGGKIVDGEVRYPGKLEAYFFPPTDIPPYNFSCKGIFTRLGLCPGVQKSDLLQAIGKFGTSDKIYSFLNTYPIAAYDSWIIPPGVVHAPGPFLTLEIQKPQDDFNLLGWQMGKRLSSEESAAEYQSLCLRGLSDPQKLLDDVVDWELSTLPDFRERFYSKARTLDEGPWGRRLSIFPSPFYGEFLEIGQGHGWKSEATDCPRAFLVWSGNGTANEQPISSGTGNCCEFILLSGNDLHIRNDGEDMLLLFGLWPIDYHSTATA